VVVGEDGRLPLPWIEPPLRQVLQQQRAHALLLLAPQGVGALEFMLTLAQAWLCEGADAVPPCGRCGSCRLLQSGAHPDLHVLLPEAMRPVSGSAAPAEDEPGESVKSRRKPSRQIRIDEVRQAIDWVVQSSSRERAKLLLLYPAEAMNLQAASALLKTLEEPPGRARVLLGAADEARLLPTVRSRCQRIRLNRPPADVASSWLLEQGVGDASVLLSAAGGAPLAALELAASGIDAAAWLAVPRAVARGQVGALAGWPVPRAVDALQKLCHDALVLAAGGTPRYFAVQALPPGANAGRLGAWARTLARAARHADHPWNEALLIEALVGEGRACWQETTTRSSRGGRALDTLRP